MCVKFVLPPICVRLPKNVFFSRTIFRNAFPAKCIYIYNVFQQFHNLITARIKINLLYIDNIFFLRVFKMYSDRATVTCELYVYVYVHIYIFIFTVPVMSDGEFCNIWRHDRHCQFVCPTKSLTWCVFCAKWHFSARKNKK